MDLSDFGWIGLFYQIYTCGIYNLDMCIYTLLVGLLERQIIMTPT